jgi:starvation-inducible DNA-binding protein
MELAHLQSTLEDTFAGNFVLYYRAHQAHVNIVGRNFASDHKLLEKVYEYLQGNIDILAEKLRTVRAKMPFSISFNLDAGPVRDIPYYGDSDELLEGVLDGINAMVEQYHALYQAAEAVDYIDISNFAQDEIATLVKYRWMLESTLEEDE